MQFVWSLVRSESDITVYSENAVFGFKFSDLLVNFSDPLYHIGGEFGERFFDILVIAFLVGNEPITVVIGGQFLEKAGIWLPCTFDRFGGTEVLHTSGNVDEGQGRRADYVGLGLNVHAVPGSATTWNDFVSPNCGVDHIPTAVAFHLEHRRSKSTVCRRRAPYDRHGWKNATKLEDFKEKLKCVSSVPDSVEGVVSRTHCHFAGAQRG